MPTQSWELWFLLLFILSPEMLSSHKRFQIMHKFSIATPAGKSLLEIYQYCINSEEKSMLGSLTIKNIIVDSVLLMIASLDKAQNLSTDSANASFFFPNLLPTLVFKTAERRGPVSPCININPGLLALAVNFHCISKLANLF